MTSDKKDPAEGELPFDPTFRETAKPAAKKATGTPRVSSDRITGAHQLGGVWYAADGSPLTAPETQQAHRAMDAAAAEARRKAMLGGGSSS